MPTMWRTPEITISALSNYLNINAIKKIIIIDNDRNRRPNANLLNSSKIQLLDFKKNIYVNPAWNIGVENANNSLMCICNDDIIIDKLIIETIYLLDLSDRIGMNLIGVRGIDNHGFLFSQFSIDKTKNLGLQSDGIFGIAMFIRKENYKPIPDDLKVWFGDDYLVRNSKNVYTIPANRFNICMASTINSLLKEGSDIQEIINQDIQNWKNNYK